MTPLDIFLIFTAFSVVILTAVLIPALLQFRRSLQKAEDLMVVLEREFVPMSKKLTAVGSEVEILAASLNARVDETEAVVKTARQASNTLLLTSQAFKDSVNPIISNIGGISAGLQMFSRILLRNKRD